MYISMKLVHEIGLGHRGAVMKRKQLKLEATNSFGTIKFEQLKKGIISCFIYCLMFFGLTACGSSVAGKENSTIPYAVPLEEIAEKFEYIYVYENMIYDISSHQYGELGALPMGENIQLTVYIAEGNKLLFIPKEKENTNVLLNGESCGMYYSERDKGYLFFVIKDWGTEEDGVPVNSLENDYYHRIRSCVVKKGERNTGDDEAADFQLEDLVKLGEIQVTFDTEETMELAPISIEGNEYIDSMIEAIQEVMRERQKYGNYEIYIDTYGRLPDKYGGATSCKVSGVIVGEGVEQYFFWDITDNEDIKNAFPTYYPSVEDSPNYFVDNFFMESVPEDFISRVMGLNRGVIPIEVIVEDGEEKEEEYVDNTIQYNQEIDFLKMNSVEARQWIEYVCSYCEWFGMNELGYREGEIKGINHKKIAIYVQPKIKNRLLFIPMDKVNTMVVGDDGREYPMYVNEEGYLEFYMLESNPYDVNNGQLEVNLFTTLVAGRRWISNEVAEMLIKVGEETIEVQELPKHEVPVVEEDEYISAMKRYVKDLLVQNGNSGRFEMYIGEYETTSTNKVCVSAAIVGEDTEYYVRYLIVKSEKGNYYFWPIGFGLNGSLEECEADRHYMNQLCIERTKQLGRSKIEINIIDSAQDSYLFNEKNTQYKCKQIERKYEVNLYDKNNREIYSVVYPKEPWIKEVTENILEIGISTGSPSRHVFYFNKETSKISDVYFNSILLDNKYVAYMENSEELIIMDIFNEGILCKKVTRDFSKTANSGSAIINIEIVDEEKILLEYLSGEDYMEVAEIIKLF